MIFTFHYFSTIFLKYQNMQLRKENQWLILSIDGKGQVVILKDANGHHGHRPTNAGADMMAVISSMSDCDQYW